MCDNLADHMVGNVYVKFREEESAAKALQAIQGRYYNGRPIVAEFSPVTDFRCAAPLPSLPPLCVHLCVCAHPACTACRRVRVPWGQRRSAASLAAAQCRRCACRARGACCLLVDSMQSLLLVIEAACCWCRLQKLLHCCTRAQSPACVRTSGLLWLLLRWHYGVPFQACNG